MNLVAENKIEKHFLPKSSMYGDEFECTGIMTSRPKIITRLSYVRIS